jgi:hypothetical protein
MTSPRTGKSGCCILISVPLDEAGAGSIKVAAIIFAGKAGPVNSGEKPADDKCPAQKDQPPEGFDVRLCALPGSNNG